MKNQKNSPSVTKVCGCDLATLGELSLESTDKSDSVHYGQCRLSVKNGH